MTDTTSCLDCIGGYALTTDQLIGSCVRKCPTCQPVCPCCAGKGLYPYWTNSVEEFIAHFNDLGLVPILCHTCGGVVDMNSIDQYTSRQPQPSTPSSQRPDAISIGVHLPEHADFLVLPNLRFDGTCALCVDTRVIVASRENPDPDAPTMDGAPARQDITIPCPWCRYDDYVAHPDVAGCDT